jgi:hypothetical protein
MGPATQTSAFIMSTPHRHHRRNGAAIIQSQG